MVNVYVLAKLYFGMTNNEKAEDFWVFSFELTNCYLFQQRLMPALHDSDVTVT